MVDPTSSRENDFVHIEIHHFAFQSGESSCCHFGITAGNGPGGHLANDCNRARKGPSPQGPEGSRKQLPICI